MQPRRAFISHSSKDSGVAKNIAERLGAANVWVDMWNLEAGDSLPSEIAQGVEGAGYFVLIASKDSMASKWVRYELNLALVRWIQDRNIRMIIIKVDDCQLHPELGPLLYKDVSSDPATAADVVESAVTGGAAGPNQVTEATPDRIVNRFPEIQALEDLANEGSKAVLLWGLYGVGKSAIVEKTARAFQRSLETFIITESHGLLRLTYEVCARAHIPFPDAAADDEELLASFASGMRALYDLGRLVAFEDVENATTDSGTLKDYFGKALLAVPFAEKIPLLMTSTKALDLPVDLAGAIHTMRVHPLDKKHLTFCLERWVHLADPSRPAPSPEHLEQVATLLDGYPLAARLAAPLVARHGAEGLIADLHHLKALKIDMAKQLIGRSRAGLSKSDIAILEVLTVAETASAEEIAVALSLGPEDVRSGIDKLTVASLVQFEGTALSCHPLIRDYVWQRAYDSGNWRNIALTLGTRASSELKKPDVQSDEHRFVELCTKAYRLLVMAGHFEDASKLTVQFKEELRGAAHRLYHAKQYELALSYLSLWVDANPHDDDTRILRARCLTRLKKYEDAWNDLTTLEEHGYSAYRIHHARGLWYRDRDNFPAALEEFRAGRDLKANYLPLLRDLGDLLARTDRLDEAREVLESAYEMASNDRFIVPKYAAVLERCGDNAKALDIATRVAGAFPDEASFQHRVAVLLAKAGRYEDALQYARSAVELDRGTPEHLLHCASVEAKLGHAKQASQLLDSLPDSQGRTKLVKQTVLAEIALSRGDIAKARQCLERYEPDRDHFVADLYGRIFIAEAQKLFGEGKVREAAQRLKSVRAILKDPRWYGNRVVEITLMRAEKFLERIGSAS